jgi:S-ribosylhomocysteine lyase
MPTTRITSFTRDHRTLMPGIYISDRKRHARYGEVTKFDLRFTRPNHTKLGPKAMHSLEHLLAIYFADYF